MARPPVFRRFAVGDFPSAPNWLINLFDPLNVFCEQTVANMNKNLAIGENVQGMKYSTTFTTSATGAVNIVFNYTGNNIPTCCLIGKIERTDNTAISGSPVLTSWSYSANKVPGQITISNINGIDPSTRYEATFLVL